MTRRRRRSIVVCIGHADDGTPQIGTVEQWRQRQEGAKIEPPKDPETLHEAMRDLSLSKRWGLEPSDKSVKIILKDYGRKGMSLVRHNKAAGDKRAQWQTWANEYWAKHPTKASRNEAAMRIKDQHSIRESVGYIAKRITKLK